LAGDCKGADTCSLNPEREAPGRVNCNKKYKEIKAIFEKSE
jgi:hypothetical protein